MLTSPPLGRLCLTALSMVWWANSVPAQSNRSAPLPAATRAANDNGQLPAARSQRLSQILNSTVALSSGVAVGEIVDVVIGPAGHVDYLVGSVDQRLYAIPYEAAILDPVQHQVRLPLTAAAFNSMSFFTVRTWPDFDSREYRLRLARTFALDEAARVSRRVTLPENGAAGPVRVVDPVRAIGNTATVPGRTHGVPLPGGTETGVRGRGTGTGTGAAAIGGAGAAGAPSGAATGAHKPVPSGPQVPQKP